MNEIISFLKRNGFKRMDEPKHYANDKCSVVIENHEGVTNYYYAVANNNGDAMYSGDANIYWLAGVLLWFGYIDHLVK